MIPSVHVLAAYAIMQHAPDSAIRLALPGRIVLLPTFTPPLAPWIGQSLDVYDKMMRLPNAHPSHEFCHTPNLLF